MNIANILAIATLAASAAPLAMAQAPAPKPLPCPAPEPLPCPVQRVDRAAILNNIVRELEAAGLPPHEILELMKVITPKVVNAPIGRPAQKIKCTTKAIPAVRIQPSPAARPAEASMKLYINGKEIDTSTIPCSGISHRGLKIRQVDPQTLNLPTPPAPKPDCDKATASCPAIKINGQVMPLPADGGKVIINTDGGVTVLPAPKPGCAAPTPASKPEGCPLPPAPKPAPAPESNGTIAKPIIGGADAPIAAPKPAPEQEAATRPMIKINGQPVELPEGGGKVIINAEGRIISRD